MILKLSNTTAGSLSYLSSTITVPATSSVLVPSYQHSFLITDGALRRDIGTGSIVIGDGTNDFSAVDGIDYLNKIFSSLYINQNTGAISSNGSSVVLSYGVASTVAITIDGTFVGTLTFKGTTDPAGLNFAAPYGSLVSAYPAPTGATVSSATTTGTWFIQAGGYTAVEVVSTAWTSGTANIQINSSSGSNFNASTNTANQGTPALIGNAWPMLVTDAVNTAAILNTAPTTQYGLVVRNIPSGTQTISGSVTVSNFPATQAVTQSGTWTTGRTWTLSNSTDSVAAVQSGTWTTARSWTLSNSTDSVASVQSGTWTTGRTWNLSSGSDSVTVTGTVAVSNAFALEATQQSVLTQVTAINANTDALEARTGDLTETAPTTDTASSGLNGRLQRIAQRLTSLIALVPTSLGQKTMANSFAVTLASDQSAVPTSSTPANVFDRIKNKNFKDTEEVRYDIPAVLASGVIYTGLNTAGTATSSASWSVVKTTFDSLGNPSRELFKTGVVWDNRASTTFP